MTSPDEMSMSASWKLIVLKILSQQLEFTTNGVFNWSVIAPAMTVLKIRLLVCAGILNMSFTCTESF